MKVSFSGVEHEVNPMFELEELEFEYCLPKDFWTNREWRKYTMLRIEILEKIKEYDEYRKICAF